MTLQRRKRLLVLTFVGLVIAAAVVAAEGPGTSLVTPPAVATIPGMPPVVDPAKTFHGYVPDGNFELLSVDTAHDEPGYYEVVSCEKV